MSRLEEAMKPILTPLILGKSTIIPSSAQSGLARWITLKVMVGEQNSPENAVFTQNQRDQFRALLLVPPQIKIWIADCGQGGWQTGYVRESGIMSLPEPDKHPTTLEHHNVAVTTFGIGGLLVHARTSNAEGVDFEEYIRLPRRL